jgi:hypothetical protein
MAWLVHMRWDGSRPERGGLRRLGGVVLAPAGGGGTMAEQQDDFVQHGGQEPPDEVQDRPEQNAGYDAAVDGLPAEEVEDEQ